MLAQLALDCKTDTELQYHLMTSNNEASLQRVSITITREKVWVPKRKMDESGRLQWHQMASSVDSKHFPNAYFTVAWEVKLVGKMITFERPFLVWAKSFNFSKGHYFRWT